MDPSSPSSVAGLAKACTGKFNELLSLKDSDLHTPLENRAADFQLWVEGVGAVARPGASLDSRFRDRPNDLTLIKGILIMLIDFLSEVSTENCSSDTALIDVDSALSNLAMIGVAIRRTGKASRSRRADQSFNPDHYEELRRHLECIILLKPSEDLLDSRGLNANEAIGSKNLEIAASRVQEMVARRLGQLDGSKLTEIQLRLVEANLRRRHRFVLAQKRSQHNKTAHQTTHHEEITLLEAEPETRSGDGATSLKESMSEKKTQALPQKKHQAPPTIALMSTASTAEGTMRYDPKAKYVPTIAQSQISAIANETEFPTMSLQLLDRQIIECPCCCQPLPYDEVRKATNWRQHLIEDICPYSCVAEQCPTPHLLFATRKAWDMHVESDHPCQWKCVVCGLDEARFSNVTDITSHIQSSHQDDLFGQSISDLIEWSRVQCMGIKSCPLCSSQGPEDSPELVDHVVRHGYEFALRSLPWPSLPVEDLNKPVGFCAPPKEPEEADRLWSWLQEAFCDGTQRTLMLSSFDHTDHEDSITKSSPQENYFDCCPYFDQISTAGSQEVAGDNIMDTRVSDRASQFTDHTSGSGQSLISAFSSIGHYSAPNIYSLAIQKAAEALEEVENSRASLAGTWFKRTSVSGIKNGPELFQRRTILHRHGAVSASCELIDVVHGLWGPSEPDTSATLLVLQFSLHSYKMGRRAVSASIQFAFFGLEKNPERNPKVAKISFLGPWRTDEPLAETNVGGLTAAVIQPAVRDAKGKILSRTITGFTRQVDSPTTTENAAAWTLEEDPGSQDGVPEVMRVGILLKRGGNHVFQCNVKLDAKFDFRTRMEQAFSGRIQEEPVLFHPSIPATNNLMDYNTNDLGAFDLSLIHEVRIPGSGWRRKLRFQLPKDQV